MSDIFDIPEFMRSERKNIDSNDFGKWVRRERVRLGVHLSQLAIDLDLSVPTISAIESGSKHIGDDQLFYSIVFALDRWRGLCDQVNDEDS